MPRCRSINDESSTSTFTAEAAVGTPVPSTVRGPLGMAVLLVVGGVVGESVTLGVSEQPPASRPTHSTTERHRRCRRGLTRSVITREVPVAPNLPPAEVGFRTIPCHDSGHVAIYLGKSGAKWVIAEATTTKSSSDHVRHGAIMEPLRRGRAPSWSSRSSRWAATAGLQDAADMCQGTLVSARRRS